VFLNDGRAKGLSPKTLDFYAQGVGALIRIVGDKPTLDVGDLRYFLARSFDEGLSPGGVHARWRAVRAFVKWLAQEGAMEDLTVRVKGPRVPEVELPVAREWEVRKMLQAAEWAKHPLRDKALLLVLWDTALRAREALGLRLGDVLPEGLRVRRKGGHVQVVPCSAPTRRALKAYMQVERGASDSDAVFLSDDGKPLGYEGLRSLLRRLAKEAGVVYRPPHAFRRGSAVALVKNGLNPFALQALMGHLSQQMTAHYVRLAERDLRELHEQASPVSRLFGPR